MKFKLMLLFCLCSIKLVAQVVVRGKIVDLKNQPVPYATVAFQSTTSSDRLEGTLTSLNGSFEIALYADEYQISLQMVGYKNVSVVEVIENDFDLGTLIMEADIIALNEVLVRADKSHIVNDLGKKTLYIGGDLANAGNTAVDALESLPSVSSTIDGAINVRGSENIIIYVNGRETKRDPKSLRFISADALQKIELITNPSAKYDAEGIAGIINLVYVKNRTKKVELVGSVSAPLRASLGLNASLSSNKFTFNLTANQRISVFETSDNQTRTTPNDSLQKYSNFNRSLGKGNTREINIGFAFEPDTSFSIGLEANYLRWDEFADQTQTGVFFYRNDDSNSILLENDWKEVEDELSLTLSSAKKLSGGQVINLQLTAGGEDEINRKKFNNRNVNLSDTPIQQSVKSSDETEDQRYYQAKLEFSFPLVKDVTIETGAVTDAFDLNVDQSLAFFNSDNVANRFAIKMNKYAGYVVMENKRQRFEYALGLRYEQFTSTSLQKSTDSTFTQRFKNFFPSLQWKYTFKEGNSSVGFNFTRRINRPSFWEISPFLSYTDPLNIETGNPFLQPEFAYLYELNWAGSLGLLSWDFTGFRRTTENIIQRITIPRSNDQLLVTYDNLGTRHNDGLELSTSLDLFEKLTIEASGSTYRTYFTSNSEAIFFNKKWNWQTRFNQRLKLTANWIIELAQYYRAPRYGAQSISLAQYYLNVSIQKFFQQKRGNITLSFRDVFNTRVFGTTVVGEEFNLKNEYKYQTQMLSFAIRYKLIGK